VSFNTIVELLEDIARRWDSLAIPTDNPTDNLASRFGRRLRDAKNLVANHDERKNDSATLDIRRPVYSEQGEPVDGETQPPSPEHQRNTQTFEVRQPQYLSDLDFNSPDSISMAFPPLPNAFQQYGFHHEVEPSQNMAPAAGASDPTQMNQSYALGPQLPHVLPSQHLNHFDFGRFDDLSNDMNQQVCEFTPSGIKTLFANSFRHRESACSSAGFKGESYQRAMRVSTSKR